MRVVISLTTIPGRATLLERTLASLQRQTCPPDAIYLWLPYLLFKNEPFAVSNMDGIIVTMGPDIGPAMKLLPVLDRELDPETCIITVDDDIEYPPGLIERLSAASNILPDHALGFTGWNRIDGPAGREIRHYNEEIFQAAMFQPVQVLEGYRGIIYRRRFFSQDIYQHLAAQPAFRFHDDILLSGYLASRGIARSVCWYTTCPPPPGSHWQLNGDSIGLHTRPEWLTEAWQAWEYWTQMHPGIFHTPPIPSQTERLQLLTGSQGRPGFLHHCLEESSNCDFTFDLGQMPWAWPDAQFSELLLLDCWPDREEIVLEWLQEAWRIMRAGGIMRIRTPLNHLPGNLYPGIKKVAFVPAEIRESTQSSTKPSPEPSSSLSQYPRWLATWHQEGNSKVGTFIKIQTPM